MHTVFFSVAPAAHVQCMAGDALVPWGCTTILRMTDRGGRSPKTNERKTLACALSTFLRTMTCEKNKARKPSTFGSSHFGSSGLRTSCFFFARLTTSHEWFGETGKMVVSPCGDADNSLDRVRESRNVPLAHVVDAGFMVEG